MRQSGEVGEKIKERRREGAKKEGELGNGRTREKGNMKKRGRVVRYVLHQQRRRKD